MSTTATDTADWARLAAADLLDPDTPGRPGRPAVVLLEVTPDGVSVACWEHADSTGWDDGYELQTEHAGVMLGELARHLAGHLLLIVSKRPG